MHVTSSRYHVIFFSTVESLMEQVLHGIKDSNSNLVATHCEKLPIATYLMEQTHSVVTLDTAFLVCYATASLQSPQ